MTLITAIADRSLLAFGALLFLIQLVAHEIGYRVGLWSASRRGAQTDSVGVVVGGMLGLLALVLALTLSFANTGFSERRAGSLAEANAISRRGSAPRRSACHAAMRSPGCWSGPRTCGSPSSRQRTIPPRSTI